MSNRFTQSPHACNLLSIVQISMSAAQSHMVVREYMYVLTQREVTSAPVMRVTLGLKQLVKVYACVCKSVVLVTVL